VTSDNGIFIYASEKMQRVKEIIDQVANTDVTVMIQGESGVGKESLRAPSTVTLLVRIGLLSR